jgi:protein associated with RNAse G/E
LRQQLDKKLLGQVEQLERDYHVKLIFDQANFPKQRIGSYLIQGKQTTLKALHEYLPMFLHEWNLYPPSLVTNTKLKYIVFGIDFKLLSETRRRNAIPDYHHDAMYYDVRSSNRSIVYQNYILIVVHHEFFHFIDFKDDGEVYEDKIWKKLNPPEFKYGKGGKYAQSDDKEGDVTDTIPGFITKYATSGVEEDKAEVFRCMMVNLRELEARAESDPVLARKIARMKELLYAFCPEMNEAYWQRLCEMERPRLTVFPDHDQWAKNHPTLPPLKQETVVVTTTIPNCPPRRNNRVTLYEMSKQGYGSVYEYCRTCR